MKDILVALVLLVIGFVLLIKGADFFVDGSSSVAKRLRVPSMIIGLTIVAMGTSLPECAAIITILITGLILKKLICNLFLCFLGEPGLSV